MLEGLRNFVSGWVAKVLLVLLIGSFAVWGISGSIFSDAASSTVATVGETDVTVTDYIAAYNRNLNQVQRQVQRGLTQQQAKVLGVEERALTDVVTGATLDEFSRELNMSLSDDTLAKMIGDNPVFHGSDGKFSRDAFQRAVQQAGLRESDFVNSQNAQAVRGQVMEAISEGDVLPDVFRTALSNYASEQRKFSYLTITPAIAGEPKQPTDGELKTYFEANAKTYAAPEFRKLSLLALEPKDVADEASLAAETVKQEYETRKASFGTPEKRRVQQIVLTQEKAEKAVADMKAGSTFETILEENNVKISDADLGLLTKDRLPKALQDIAFTLEPNNVSDIVKGPFGATLLRVSEIEPASQKPFEEVEAEIRKDLALREAADRVIRLQTDIEDARAGGATLEEAADQFDVKTRTIEAVDRNGRDSDGKVIADIPNSRAILEETFKTEVGEQTSPLDLNTLGSVWYEVLDIIPARDRTLDEVKQRVTDDWLAAERATIVETKTEELKKRLDNGELIFALAAELGAPVKETALLSRAARDEAFPPAAVTAGFNGDSKSVAIADGVEAGTKILLKVTESKSAEAEISASVTQEMQRANAGAANDLLEQLITRLQTGYEVNYNPTVIQQALAHR